VYKILGIIKVCWE